MTVVYEDNHIIIVNKTASEIVQGDKTGDTPLSETVKQYLKEKYSKPGNVFIGVAHRLDRPVSGLVVFAKTSKALSRLNEMFKNSEVKKTYWAVVKNLPREEEGELVNYLVRGAGQQESDFALPAHRAVAELLSVGNRFENRTPSPDTLSVGKDGLSHQGRFEVWFAPLQSRRQHLSACAVYPFCASGVQRTDRSGGARSSRKFMEWF